MMGILESSAFFATVYPTDVSGTPVTTRKLAPEHRFEAAEAAEIWESPLDSVPTVRFMPLNLVLV